MNATTPSTPGAIFLSYAHEDTDSARCIAEALRAAGVEVWFDQSELRGGDAWDAKIRQQIRECALFAPIISPNTNARTEGYFRREWKQAVERTHDMADDVPFLFPIVLEDVTDATARVPDKFRDVQWTRLPEGEIPAAFCGRVEKLLGRMETEPERLRRGLETRSGRATLRVTPFRPWFMPTILGLMAVAAVAVWKPWKSFEPGPVGRGEAARLSTPVSEATQLVTKVWELLNKPSMARAELNAADALCERAATLDPTDAEVWAAWAHVNGWFIYHNLDSSAKRHEAAREYASRAMQLAPNSFEARLAQAFYWARVQYSRTRSNDAQRLLRDLLQERPDEPRALFTLGYLLVLEPAKADEGTGLLERLAQNPGFAAVAWDEIGWTTFFTGDFAAAEVAADRSLAAEPYWNNLGLKITLAERVHGDMEMAQSVLDKMPVSALQEDWGIGFSCEVYQWRREPWRTIKVLEGVPRDWIHYFFNDLPKPFLLGEARLMAKQEGAARRDFQRALDLIELQLIGEPNGKRLLGLKARTLRYLGQHEEAEKTFRLVKELGGEPHLQVIFQSPEVAITYLRSMTRSTSRGTHRMLYTAAALRLDPYFDPLQSDSGFQALLAELENREKPVRPVVAKASDDKSIAVLPFIHLSEESDSTFFTDGLHEDILTNLANIGDLRVVSRTSVMEYRNTTKKISQIATELGVAYILEGSVRRAGGKLRLTGQLIDVRIDGHLWAKTYDRELTDVFAIQSELAREITGALHAVLSPQEKARLEQTRTASLEAYDLLLKARELPIRGFGVVERSARRLELLEQSVRLDPGLVQGWVDLSNFYSGQYFVHFDRSPARLAQAREAIGHATRLAPEDPSVVLAEGIYYLNCFRDYARARTIFERLQRQLPNLASVYGQLGNVASREGRWVDAVENYRRLCELDPRSYNALGSLQDILQTVRRNTEALDVARQMAAIRPDDLSAGYRVAETAFYAKGDARIVADWFASVPDHRRSESEFREAQREWAWTTGNAGEWLRLSREQTGPVSVGLRGFNDIGYATLLSGDRESARLLLEQTRKESDDHIAQQPENRRYWMRRAFVLAALGEADAAVVAADRARELMPESLDTKLGSVQAGDRAGVLALAGRKDEALKELARLFRQPGRWLNVHEMRHSLSWKSLQGDPRFEALLNDPKNNAPLF